MMWVGVIPWRLLIMGRTGLCCVLINFRGYCNCFITEESGQLLAFCLFGYILVPLAAPFGITNGAGIHQR